MEKIDIDVLRLTEGYKQYLKTLVGTNGENKGYDVYHKHITPDGETMGWAIGNNFFLHQHATPEGNITGRPYEYDPDTLEHHHLVDDLNRNGANEVEGTNDIVIASS